MPTSTADLVARVVECDKPPGLKDALLQVAAHGNVATQHVGLGPD